MKFKTLCDLVELIDGNQNQLGIDYIKHYNVTVFDGGKSGNGFKNIRVDHDDKMIIIEVAEKE